MSNMRTEHKTIARQRKKTGGSILVVGILGVLILFLFSASPGNAQALEDWSVPIRLSSEGTNSSEGYMVADDFGWVHTFWLEIWTSEGAVKR